MSAKPMATLTVHGLSRMTPRTRLFVSGWLRDQANAIADAGATTHAERFTARVWSGRGIGYRKEVGRMAKKKGGKGKGTKSGKC